MAKTAAVMSGDLVTNIIVVDDIEQSAQDLGATLIEYTAENPAGIGWTYNGTTFVAPVVEEITE
jgi:hypothetical protein